MEKIIEKMMGRRVEVRRWEERKDGEGKEILLIES